MVSMTNHASTKPMLSSPVIGALAQLPHGDRELGGAVRLEQLLQPHQPLVGLVDDGERLPAPRLYQVHVRLNIPITGPLVRGNRGRQPARRKRPPGCIPRLSAGDL